MTAFDEMVAQLKEKNRNLDKALARADVVLSGYEPDSLYYRSIKGFYFQPSTVAHTPRHFKIGSRAKIVFRDRTDVKSYHDIKDAFIHRAKALGANALIDVKCSGGQMVATPAFLLEAAEHDDNYRSKIAIFEARLVGQVSDPVIVSFERKRMVKLEKEVSYWRGHNDGYYLNHHTSGKFPPSDKIPKA